MNRVMSDNKFARNQNRPREQKSKRPAQSQLFKNNRQRYFFLLLIFFVVVVAVVGAAAAAAAAKRTVKGEKMFFPFDSRVREFSFLKLIRQNGYNCWYGLEIL